MKKLSLVLFPLLVVSLFVLAQEPTTTPTTTPESTTTPPKEKEIDLNCMKNAIEKRENAIKTAKEAYFNKVLQALEERKTALLNAWTIENQKERQRAVRAAWDNFRNSVKSAKSEYKKAHNQAWNTFVKNRQACKFGPTGENPGIDLTY